MFILISNQEVCNIEITLLYQGIPDQGQSHQYGWHTW